MGLSCRTPTNTFPVRGLRFSKPPDEYGIVEYRFLEFKGIAV
jgi:hypothetical protein